jgi:hypothetical protein
MPHSLTRTDVWICIGTQINLVSGRPQDAAFALCTVVPADKAAIPPDAIPFTDGVVVPFALEAAICTLSLEQPGTQCLASQHLLSGCLIPRWSLHS